MFAVRAIEATDKAAFYRELCDQLRGLLDGESDAIANAANTSALIFQTMPDINWAGFYFLQSPDELVVGPFQGKPACVRICGRQGCLRNSRRAVQNDTGRRRSSISRPYRLRRRVPLGTRRAAVRGGAVLGVLDLDSPLPGRFDIEDQAGVERLAAIYLAACSRDG